jgi:hypothetical protein
MQANRFAKWAGSNRPSLENAGLTGLKSASAPVHPRPFIKSEARPVQTESIPTEGCSNPSNPKPRAMGLTPSWSKTEEIRGFKAVQTRQTRQTPNVNDAEHEIVSRAVTVPAGDDAAAWAAWFAGEVAYRARLGAAAARRRVYGLAVLRWHARHGIRPDVDRCVGCGALLDQDEGMDLGDGAWVHLGGALGLDCLTMYGAAWRGAAEAGLLALGIAAPDGWHD